MLTPGNVNTTVALSTTIRQPISLTFSWKNSTMRSCCMAASIGQKDTRRRAQVIWPRPPYFLLP